MAAKCAFLLSRRTLSAYTELKLPEHSGRTTMRCLRLPGTIEESINKILLEEKSTLQRIKLNAERINSFLNARVVPFANSKKSMLSILKWKTDILDELEKTTLSSKEKEQWYNDVNNEAKKMQKIIRESVGLWTEMKYETHTDCLSYTLARSSQNYAVTVRVFNEIFSRDQNFSPRNVLDFGSGCGSVIWALHSLWPGSTDTFYLTDPSAEFNDLSCSILAGDDTSFDPTQAGLYYKLHLPISEKPVFDLTISAYSLSELSGPQARRSVLQRLFRCSSDYVIIIENGTLRSHHLMEEIREFVSVTFGETYDIFAPCPHLKPCPLLLLNLQKQKQRYICRNEVKYMPFALKNHTQSNSRVEKFTYLIFKRKTTSNCSYHLWPRIVQEPKKRGEHVILRLCHSDGDVSETIVSKGKYPKLVYKAARKSELGERFPMPPAPTEDESFDGVDGQDCEPGTQDSTENFFDDDETR